MRQWRVSLNGVDISRSVEGWQASYSAENVCGQVDITLATRAPLQGVALARVPRAVALSVETLINGALTEIGPFFLERIQYPEDRDADTATLWGRSRSAQLGPPWAPKISKQWTSNTTVSAIVHEMATLCGVTVDLTNDYSICAYCFVVSDKYPSEVLQELATLTGQICWPQPDGSLAIGPRQYPPYPTPALALTESDIETVSVTRTEPDFGNRILVSGSGSVAGITVSVVPMSDADACVAAAGASTVRLIAVVTGSDGAPVALGTDVTWSASGGLIAEAVTQVALVQRASEAKRATDYYHVTLDLPAESVIGVYARKDLLKKTNLYVLRSGSVSGNVITFGQALDYYDQALVIDYMVQGAPGEWVAGWAPGDVTILASAAGAQGSTVLHQSNPTACPTQVTLAASAASPCLGEAVTITLRAIMFGGAALGTAIFSLSGCGTLSAARKTLTAHEITETLRASVWGGASEIKLTAVPVAGSSVSVALASNPGGNLYAAHSGQTVQLNAALEAGTQVTATYTGGGTAKVTWTPTSLPAGLEHIDEWLYTTQAEVDGVTVGQVTLSRTPATSSTPICTPLSSNDDYFSNRSAKLVTLIDEPFTTDPLPAGTYIRCTYDCVWSQQPDCEAVISVKVLDGSEDGGSGSITVTADDCRTVHGDDYDPDDDTQTEETGETDDTDEDTDADDDTDFDPEEDAEDQPSPTGCTALDINARISAVTAANIAAVAGVGNVDDCPGLCTCDQICDALRSSGKLGSAGLFYSQCVKSCTDTRAQKCTSCTLSGPDTLSPGETGVWDDGRGNTGTVTGGLTEVSRSAAGYVLKMPTGGSGPFDIKVCYGSDASQCCDAQVDFPPCTVTGPTQLDPGGEGMYLPSLGMTGATVAVTGEMTYVRDMAYGAGVIVKMIDGACTGGAVTISYGGRVCGTVKVASSLVATAGVVIGDSELERSESATYFHNLGPGATYTGTLPLISAVESGAICQMPLTANYYDTYTVSWSGSCGRSASMTVTPGWATGQCGAPTCGAGPAPVGSLVSISNVPYRPAGTYCYRVLPTYTEATSWWDNAPCGVTTRPAWTVINVSPYFMGVQALEADFYGAKLYQVEAVDL